MTWIWVTCIRCKKKFCRSSDGVFLSKALDPVCCWECQQ